MAPCYSWCCCLRFNRSGMITIRTIITAINTIPSVEPASETLSAIDDTTGSGACCLWMGSWLKGISKLKAALVRARKLPVIMSNVGRSFL